LTVQEAAPVVYAPLPPMPLFDQARPLSPELANY